jgi:hypothetical protein
VFVSNNEDAAVAAAHRVDPDRWWMAYGAVIDRIAPRFARYEPLRVGLKNFSPALIRRLVGTR